MIETTVPELPDEPTPEQYDAWIELSAILNDPSLVANMRANASDVWDRDVLDLCRLAPRASEPMLMRSAKQAIAEATRAGFGDRQGDWRTSGWRRRPGCWGGSRTSHFRNWLRSKYALHDARAARYWELVAIMRGQPPDGESRTGNGPGSPAAMRHHLAD